MKTTDFARLALLAAVLLGASACNRAPQITERQRTEAAHFASEADFALSLRDWARAEGLLAKAAQLCPDTGAYWVNLGSTRVRLGNRAGAKQAYEAALKAFGVEAYANKQSPDAWFKQAHVLALLGKPDEGRALLQQALKQFPDHRDLRLFIEKKHFDRMMEQREFQEMKL